MKFFFQSKSYIVVQQVRQRQRDRERETETERQRACSWLKQGWEVQPSLLNLPLISISLEHLLEMPESPRIQFANY